MCLIHIGKKKYIESAFLCIGAFVIISASNNDEISFHMLHVHIYITYVDEMLLIISKSSQWLLSI